MIAKMRRGERKNGYELSLEDDLDLDPLKEITRRKNGAVQWSTRAHAQLDRQIYAALSAQHPQTTRQIYYVMTGGQLMNVAKDKAGYRRVQSRTLILRRNNIVKAGWIYDATRSSNVAYFDTDAADFIEGYADRFYSDPWAGADYYVEVTTEARGVVGTIGGICDKYRVTYTGAGGFASDALAVDMAERIKACAQGRPAILLHIGDYDPSGLGIDRQIERDIRAGLAKRADFKLRRIAVTPEQIASLNLPVKEAKKGTHNPRNMKEAVEAESIPAAMLRRILANAIEEYLPKGALEEALALDRQEQKRLLAAAQSLRS
jgi:hypothetical protein